MAFKQPLYQTRHDILSEDPNIKSDSERNTTRSGMMESFGKALGVAASFFPLGRVVKSIQGGTKVGRALSNTPKQYMKPYKVDGKLYGHFDKSGKLTNKYVPVVGKPGTTVKVPKNSSTKQVSYANPRISMTPEERLKAGY
tara:strand:+ start:3613 stop:4035 length:423 start_codon:yes stop_codon:yes gene_type:complete